ncbi:SUMF1/EgtB/PvdO family nonheme iron enzyme [Bacteroidota bacterium]
MKKKRFFLFFFPGIIIGIFFIFLGNKAVSVTSTDKYCASCHVHPQADQSWKKSTHYNNKSGVQVHCVQCHLPPHGEGYLGAKIKTGLKDLFATWFKDSADYNWEEKSRLENAVHFVPEESCIACHQTIFMVSLSKEGEEAHLYYSEKIKKENIHCINCHIGVGHYNPDLIHAKNLEFGKGSEENTKVYKKPASVKKFENYTEYIPGSTISFNMKAIPGGKFIMGSPDDEPYRDNDEGPLKEIAVKAFFMAEIEVSWDEFLVFYSQTSGEGRSSDSEASKKQIDVDAIAGATPPYGQPDQNWGLGKRPAITMTWHAAETYCKWLSKVTGKNYRLPTEAEWEYACRAGTTTPYFFEGSPKKFHKTGFFSKFSSNDTTIINSFVIYSENSKSKTQPPESVLPNKFGLRNMLGNVAEFCSDWYSENTYSDGSADNPAGPESGTEHVVRGGSYKDNAGNLRAANRDFTKKKSWLRTDPQIPKSIWWYSDCSWVGIRVVCDYDENTANK